MKIYYKILIGTLLTAGTMSLSEQVVAGNEDRAGQAGATELLINPWARSSGWSSANAASVQGLEAMYLNVAGTAFTKKTELLFSYTSWLKGSGININTFGLTQRVGETGVIGLGIMSMDMGDIEITTTDLPEGGIGTFSPQYMNLGLSYAKEFSRSIYGGLNVKLISEGIADVKAMGIAFDAGIQYITGTEGRARFGIALKNVGPPMRFSGDGLSFRGLSPNGAVSMTVEQRSERFELPSLVNIGGAYDFKLTDFHRLTLAGTFTSNSFTKDQYALGLEYGFRNYFMFRVGYGIEAGSLTEEERTTALTGLSTGFTLEVPFKKESTRTFGLDYSYRATDNFEGTHSVGARINL